MPRKLRSDAPTSELGDLHDLRIASPERTRASALNDTNEQDLTGLPALPTIPSSPKQSRANASRETKPENTRNQLAIVTNGEQEASEDSEGTASDADGYDSTGSNSDSEDSPTAHQEFHAPQTAHQEFHALQPSTVAKTPSRAFSQTPLHLLTRRLVPTYQACNEQWMKHQQAKDQHTNRRRRRRSSEKTSLRDSPEPAGPSSMHGPSMSTRSAKQKRPDFEQAPDGPRNGGYDTLDDDYIWRAGEMLESRWEVKRLMGRGSFGQVVEALDVTSSEPVAIKIIKARQSFAAQATVELDILNFLKINDTHDQHNIGGLLNGNANEYSSSKGAFCAQRTRLHCLRALVLQLVRTTADWQLCGHFIEPYSEILLPNLKVSEVSCLGRHENYSLRPETGKVRLAGL